MKFIFKRLIITVITLFLVSLMTFAAFNIIPGDPATLILGLEASADQVRILREEMGLDKGLGERYFTWLKGFFTGKLGNSVRFRGAPIGEIIAERFPITISLASLALAFTIVIAVGVSLLSAKKENSPVDRVVSTLTTITIALPGFFLGVLFSWFFGIILKFFSPGAYVPYEENPAGFIRYLVFPALAIALPNAAVVTKFLRAGIFHELRSAYLRTAYSKGASTDLALRRHVLKNALIPAITLLGMIIGDLFSGSIVIEQVFTIPGIGRLLITSITSRDFTLVQTLVVYIAAIVVAANTLVDIAIQTIDPRIRIS
jgi:ABC-type dipeptide/oligopeptide/nickel transport system permease component